MIVPQMTLQCYWLNTSTVKAEHEQLVTQLQSMTLLVLGQYGGYVLVNGPLVAIK